MSYVQLILQYDNNTFYEAPIEARKEMQLAADTVICRKANVPKWKARLIDQAIAYNALAIRTLDRKNGELNRLHDRLHKAGEI
jgi:hypothetical protein